MISRSWPPAVGTIQMCGVFVLASRFTSTTLKITHLPSGETSGSPTRFSFIMSSKVKGCLTCAKADNVRTMRARKTRKKRRMREPPQQTHECSRGKLGGSSGKPMAQSTGVEPREHRHCQGQQVPPLRSLRSAPVGMTEFCADLRVRRLPGIHQSHAAAFE